jgi:hypothetical protein
MWTASRANSSLSPNGFPSANGGASTSLGLKHLHAQEMGGQTDPGMGQASRLKPILARFGCPFAHISPLVIMHFPPPFAPFWRCHPHIQDGGSFRMKFIHLHFNPQGCSFVPLWFLPPLGVISSSSQTRTGLHNCSFELVVTPSFMSMFSYKNLTLPNAYTKMNLLCH